MVSSLVCGSFFSLKPNEQIWNWYKLNCPSHGHVLCGKRRHWWQHLTKPPRKDKDPPALPWCLPAMAQDRLQTLWFGISSFKACFKIKQSFSPKGSLCWIAASLGQTQGQGTSFSTHPCHCTKPAREQGVKTALLSENVNQDLFLENCSFIQKPPHFSLNSISLFREWSRKSLHKNIPSYSTYQLWFFTLSNFRPREKNKYWNAHRNWS